MVHHQVDVLLDEPVKGRALGEYAPYELMVVFDGPFLVRGGGIAIEQMHPCHAIAVRFKGGRVGEFTPIVSQDSDKEPGKHVGSEERVQMFHDVMDRGGGVAVPEKGEHEFRFDKVDGQEHLSAFGAFNGVHLYDRAVRISFKECTVVFQGAPCPACPVHLEILFRLARPVPHLSRKVDVFCGEDPVADVVVNGLFAAHDFCGVVHIDVMDGMPLPDKGRNNAVKGRGLFFTHTYPAPGLRPDSLVFLVRVSGGVEAFFKGASATLVAAVADIGRGCEPYAGLSEIIFAQAMAAQAVPAEPAPAVRIGAQVLQCAAEPVGTVIERPAEGAALLKDDMAVYFLGDCGIILSDAARDGSEGHPLVEALFNEEPF